MSNEAIKEIAISFLQLVADGQVNEAYERYIGEAFVHHNPYFEAGAQALKRGMEQSAEMTPQKQFTVKFAIAEKNQVMTYSYLKQKAEDTGAIVVHILRIQDGKIIEMWDVGQAIPEQIINSDGLF